MGTGRAHPPARVAGSEQRPRRVALTARLVVINADDLGFAPGVTRGIVEAHAAGAVSSASMMVNTTAFGAAAAVVREHMPTLGVGLHLNLLVGQPLSAVPTLANPRTGDFYSLAELATRAFSGRVSADDVRRECDAQLAALAREALAPTHLDSHRHTHALPGILPAVLASARSAGVRFVRRPLDAPSLREPATGAKILALHGAWRLALRDVPESDRDIVDRAPNFRGIALQGAPDVSHRLLAMLDRLAPTPTEIMMHPGYDDPQLGAFGDTYRTERQREVSALCSPLIRERLTRGDIRLVHFGML